MIVFNETNIYESFYFPEWTGFKIDTHDNYYINGQVMDDPECLMGLDFYLTSTFLWRHCLPIHLCLKIYQMILINY